MSVEQLMICFILIEIFQVFFILVQIYKTRQQMNQLFTEPAFAGKIMENALHGFIEGLVEDPKKQENFFGFVQVIGQSMMAGATGGAVGAPAKPVKLKGMARILEPFINNPQMQGMISNKVGEMLANTGAKGAKKAAEAVTEGWG